MCTHCSCTDLATWWWQVAKARLRQATVLVLGVMRVEIGKEVFVCDEAQAGFTTSGDERVWLSSVLFVVESF
jgi:hypothetical protein